MTYGFFPDAQAEYLEMGKFRLQHSPIIVVAPAIGSSVLGSGQYVKWIAVALCSAAAVYRAA